MTATVIDLNLVRTERASAFLKDATARGNAVYAAWKAADKPKDGNHYEWDNALGRMIQSDPGDEA